MVIHHRTTVAMVLPPPCTCTYTQIIVPFFFACLLSSTRTTRFTFLATLFLLLFVSSAIILRSFILRRRFRQRIEEAILAGVIVPNPTGRVNRRRALGEKPKLWEARVFPADDDRWDSIVVRRSSLSPSIRYADSIFPPSPFFSHTLSSVCPVAFVMRRRSPSPYLRCLKQASLPKQRRTRAIARRRHRFLLAHSLPYRCRPAGPLCTSACSIIRFPDGRIRSRPFTIWWAWLHRPARMPLDKTHCLVTIAWRSRCSSRCPTHAGGTWIERGKKRTSTLIMTKTTSQKWSSAWWSPITKTPPVGPPLRDTFTSALLWMDVSCDGM